MWRNPNYPAPERPTPPQETGVRLLTLPRPNDAELRVSLDEFNGHNYISLRVWEPGRNGEGMWPTKKGVTVRLGECQALARVLTETAAASAPVKGFGGGAAGETSYSPPRDDSPKFVDKGRPGRQPFDPAAMPKLEGGAEGFDEFQGGDG